MAGTCDQASKQGNLSNVATSLHACRPDHADASCTSRETFGDTQRQSRQRALLISSGGVVSHFAYVTLITKEPPKLSNPTAATISHMCSAAVASSCSFGLADESIAPSAVTSMILDDRPGCCC